ncbi:MAG: hypothetical protein II479_08085, partial [Bacteroidales bacterium]|nr:hypothetical protein [Bacteroidales bacterium]
HPGTKITPGKTAIEVTVKENCSFGIRRHRRPGELEGSPLNHPGTKITRGKTAIEVTVKENFYLEV